MAIQYVDANADAVCTINDTYNIVASTNDKLSVTIDSGSAQVFTLTTGASRTAANIVADLSALSGAVASVVTINGSNFVRIRTNSSNSNSSSILINTPSNNANATLGFTATTYFGGINVNTTFVVSTKQNLIDGIETALLTAGWITISGHTTTNLLMQSSMSPNPQNLRMRLRIKDNGNNCVVLSIENVAGTKVGASSTGAGAQLLPGSAVTWRIIANKYQGFALVNGNNTARQYAGWGTLALPVDLQGVVFEAIWLNGNADTDTDTTARGCFRGNLGGWDTTNGPGNAQHICNNNIWELANSSGNDYFGAIALITMFQGIRLQENGATWYRWHDGNAFISEPIMAWGITGFNVEGMGRGLLWDAFISTEAYAIDTLLSSLDSHNWYGLTNNNTGTAQAARGTLFVVVP